MKAHIALAALFAAALVPAAAFGADSGPAHTVAHLRSQARRLLALGVRADGVDPKNVVISDVAVHGAHAQLSWDSGKSRGVMSLEHRGDRWWDVTADAQASHAGAAWSISPHGALIHPPRNATAQYAFWFKFPQSDAGTAIELTQIYARAPTAAEFLSNPAPAPGWGGPDAVCYFDLGIGGTKAVAFTPGMTIDVWFPFVLDDQLQYNLSFFSDDKPSGMIGGTIFDNTLHFVLPAFVMAPGKPLMAEIDGDEKPSQ